MTLFTMTILREPYENMCHGVHMSCPLRTSDEVLASPLTYSFGLRPTGPHRAVRRAPRPAGAGEPRAGSRARRARLRRERQGGHAGDAHELGHRGEKTRRRKDLGKGPGGAIWMGRVVMAVFSGRVCSESGPKAETLES